MKIPVVIQRDAKDCGPACLKSIASYYGKDLSLSYLREKCFTNRTGTTFLGLAEACEELCLRTVTANITWEQLKSSYMPCLLYWNHKHFIVLYKIKGTRVWVMDPAQGILKYRLEDFVQIWQKSHNDHMGTVMFIEPKDEFSDLPEIKESKKFNFGSLLKYLTPFRRYIIQLIFAILLGSLLSLIFPFFTQAIVDIGIANSDLNFIIILLFAQIILTLGQTVNNFIRNWLMMHITTRVSISLISEFLGKLMRLPIAFFDTKLTGDILQRIKDFDRIQNFLTGSLISICISIITFVVYSSIMVNYSLKILTVFLTGSALHATWVLLFMARRKKLNYMRFQQAAENQSNVIELINGMQEIKMNNCEDTKRWKWERIQVQLYRIDIKNLSLRQMQRSGASLINSCTNALVSFLAARCVVKGYMTLGMMMAMQYILGQLNGPIYQFIGFVQDTQDAQISLERLNEIKDREDEEPNDRIFEKHIPDQDDILFDNVSFRYGGKCSPMVLKEINVKIEAGKTTAIVGVSGSGKTTLLKLLLGFYEPTTGKVYLGNKELKEYSPGAWRSKCGVVMQEGFIFSDNIANNIAPADPVPDNTKLIKACKQACIYEFVETLPWGFETTIGPQGIGLSSGQKQRLLIARTIYKDPPYIIFDEATNSLDANNERCIIDNMQTFFANKTVIVVAHRLSTVKNAHKILVLDNGRIVEEGTHQELVALKASYYTLVKNQLELGK